MTIETLALPSIVIRGRSFMALIVSPEMPLAGWCAALDQQMSKSAGFFADRPIVANLSGLPEGRENFVAALEALEARGLSLVGVEGIDPALLDGTIFAHLPQLAQGRELRDSSTDRNLAIPEDAAAPLPAPAPASLVVDRAVRSGQSIIFEEGDVTIIGSVASGAEVIAGGSIHIYGALRGRAVAGLRSGAGARIFCQKLAAELVAIDGLYHTAEDWGEDLRGRAVQVRLDQGALKMSALD